MILEQKRIKENEKPSDSLFLGHEITIIQI